MHKTGHLPLRVSKTANSRGLHKHTFNKTILGSFSNNGFETSSRNGKENSNKRKDRQTISRADFLNSIYEYKRRFQQKGHIQHNRWYRTEDKQIDGHDG